MSLIISKLIFLTWRSSASLVNFPAQLSCHIWIHYQVIVNDSLFSICVLNDQATSVQIRNQQLLIGSKAVESRLYARQS